MRELLYPSALGDVAPVEPAQPEPDAGEATTTTEQKGFMPEYLMVPETDTNSIVNSLANDLDVDHFDKVEELNTEVRGGKRGMGGVGGRGVIMSLC